MGTMTKDALIRAVSEATGQPVTATKATIEAFCSTVQNRAAHGDTVKLMGFGTFQVKARAARMGRNPATGEQIEIAETNRLTFRASKVS